MTTPTAVQLPRLSRSTKALLSSPLALALLAAIRLIIICDYNIPAATKMATTGGITATLLGTIIPLVPPYLPVAVVLLALTRKWFACAITALAVGLVSPAYASLPSAVRRAWSIANDIVRTATQHQWHQVWNDNWQVTGCLALGIAIALYTIINAPLRMRIHGVILAVLLWIINAAVSLIVGVVVAVASAAILLLAQQMYVFPLDPTHAWEIARRPWLPSEEIRTSSNETAVGYVLSTSDEWFVVLTENDRTITYIPSSDVIARTVCSTTPTDD